MHLITPILLSLLSLPLTITAIPPPSTLLPRRICVPGEVRAEIAFFNSTTTSPGRPTQCVNQLQHREVFLPGQNLGDPTRANLGQCYNLTFGGVDPEYFAPCGNTEGCLREQRPPLPPDFSILSCSMESPKRLIRTGDWITEERWRKVPERMKKPRKRFDQDTTCKLPEAALLLINKTICAIPAKNNRILSTKDYKMPTSTSNFGEKPSNSNTEPTPTTDSSLPSAGAAPTFTDSSTVQKKTEAEEAADRLYEERIEEEYAKREGGA
ncbi:hypothetical protein G7Y89_g1769 [Cudoniella acicularis]|uniref:Uncharacterized protein n=1 Tax=Cudoniella acicularis TaxID=354080 RepID=A0A8H4RXI9_9HELO|nr:hypothetical protein G7Y89_g1769 [Cudoniella acicularis]